MANELVLIVEDNERNRLLAAEVLRFNGYDTIETDNAEDGIEIARQKCPALIIMDFHLPGMDGIDALRALRADAATKTIPVIAVTASAMTDEQQKIIAAGFDGVTTKPIHIKQFAELVQNAIAQSKGPAV